MRWETVITAPDQLTAEVWGEFLRKRGVPAMLKAGDTNSFLGISPFPCRLLVPQQRLAEASQLLDELTSAASLAEELEDQEGGRPLLR